MKKRLAEHHGVTSAEVVVGNGTNEIITLLARTFLAPGDEAVISQQTFAIYQIALQACDRPFTAVPMRGHRYDSLRHGDGRGAHAAHQDLLHRQPGQSERHLRHAEGALRGPSLKKVPPGCLTVLDEAYFEFAHGAGLSDYPDGSELRKRYPRLVVLRTFSKIYGLAGVRVGYGLCEPDVAQYLDRVRDAFNVSSIGQWAGIARCRSGRSRAICSGRWRSWPRVARS